MVRWSDGDLFTGHQNIVKSPGSFFIKNNLLLKWKSMGKNVIFWILGNLLCEKFWTTKKG